MSCSLQYKYFTLVNSFNVTKFISKNPNYVNEFKQFHLQYNTYVDNLYKIYVSRYIKRNLKFVNRKYLKHTYYIHNNIYIPSLKDTYKKTKITKDIIKIYLENLEISELIYYLNK